MTNKNSNDDDADGDHIDDQSDKKKFDNPMEPTTTTSSPMVDCSLLSHVMLKVPNVRTTVKYWIEQHNGQMTRSSNPKKTKKETKTEIEEEATTNGAVSNSDDEDNEEELQSAFVELGHYKVVGGGSGAGGMDSDGSDDSAMKRPPPSFSLELVTTSETNFNLGNCISYIGINMLQQFSKDPLEVISRKFVPGIPIQPSSDTSKPDEPNGIPIKYVASSPGDMIARIAFYTTNLEATYKFYTQILGMDCKAQDDTMICLRYNNNSGDGEKSRSGMGVPTTLVFEKTNEDIDIGNCLDHLVIATTANIDDLYSTWKKKHTPSTTETGEQGGREASSTSTSSSSSSTTVNGDGSSSSSSSSSTTTKSSSSPTIFMNPTNMFGKKVMGIFDPNGYKVIIAGESS